MAGACWRAVEAQHRVSTMKIVDTLAEQERLEQLVEESKPPVPADCRGVHYLLSTPFRYGAPYPNGSRFRRAGFTPGVFYSSKTPTTAIVEAAFHRLLFFADSPGMPWPDNAVEFTTFSTRYRTATALDLIAPPFDRDRATWTHATDYAPCQQLADDARSVGAEVIRYPSARDAGSPRGVNIAILTCRAFGSQAPLERQTWRIHFGASGVRAICTFPEKSLELDRDAFAHDPRIVTLQWNRPHPPSRFHLRRSAASVDEPR